MLIILLNGRSISSTVAHFPIIEMYQFKIEYFDVVVIAPTYLITY